MNQKQVKSALICGILGCLCYDGGDWLWGDNITIFEK